MIETLPKNPLELFKEWFEEAKKSEPNDPDATCLATCDSKGQPHARMVLLKGYDEKGFRFFTNEDSHKGVEIKENAQGALCFYWKSTRKQIRMEGKIEEAGATESDEYFTSRPRGAQIGAWASAQSRPLESRESLEQDVRDFEKKFKDDEIIPRPPHWKGYRLVPDSIEFWIAQLNRLHDRFEYKRDNSDNWSITRLYP